MDLEDLRGFVAVVEEGSFSAASRKLGVSKSTISERVSRLEQELGLTLMHRSTRKFRLTERGDELFRRGHDIMSAALEAEEAMSENAEHVVGRVRVSAPVSLGMRYLGPPLARLCTEHPELHVDIELSDSNVDLFEQPVDLALRVGTVTQPGLITSHVGQFKRLLIASPSYLKRHGKPKSKNDLSNHRCLRFSLQQNPEVWTLGTGKNATAIRVDGPLVSNNGDLIAQLAEADAGIAWLPEFIVEDALRQGRLISVLTSIPAGTLPLQLVYPTRRYMPPRVRAVSDELKRVFRRPSCG